MILDFGWIGGVEGNWRKYKAPRQF
jgi:hypothetical protein